MIFQVKSKLRSRPDKYKVSITSSGWSIQNLVIGGDCDQSAKPYLFNNFDQDSVIYPNDFHCYFSYLWEEAKRKKLSEDEIQIHLNELSEFLDTFQEVQPEGIFWNGYR